jgi:hypothetical protein
LQEILSGLIFNNAEHGRSLIMSSLATKGVLAMKVNVGSIDRVVRIVAGLALVGLAVAGTIGPWGYIGVVPLLTGLMRVCPAYSLIGVNTCSTSTSSEK